MTFDNLNRRKFGRKKNITLWKNLMPCFDLYIVKGFRASKNKNTKLFPTSFDRSRFQGNLLIIKWRQIDFGLLCHQLSSKVTWMLWCRLKWTWKGSARVFIFYFMSSWFSPAENKVFSFWIQKFSRCIKRSRKMSLELEVFTSLSMIINLAWLLKFWPCCWKYLPASIAFGSLVSFLWLFNLMLNAVSTFPSYCLLHSVHSIKRTHFCS